MGGKKKSKKYILKPKRNTSSALLSCLHYCTLCHCRQLETTTQISYGETAERALHPPPRTAMPSPPGEATYGDSRLFLQCVMESGGSGGRKDGAG